VIIDNEELAIISALFSTEILLNVRYAFGECYYEVTKDQAEELLETKKEAIAGEIATIEEELSTVRSTLGDLKAALYSRFGKSINLEE